MSVIEYHRSRFWPELSAHRLYWENHNNPHVYEYDPAEDGPEVEVINALILDYTWFRALTMAADGFQTHAAAVAIFLKAHSGRARA